MCVYFGNTFCYLCNRPWRIMRDFECGFCFSSSSVLFHFFSSTGTTRDMPEKPFELFNCLITMIIIIVLKVMQSYHKLLTDNNDNTNRVKSASLPAYIGLFLINADGITFSRVVKGAPLAIWLLALYVYGLKLRGSSVVIQNVQLITSTLLLVFWFSLRLFMPNAAFPLPVLNSLVCLLHACLFVLLEQMKMWKSNGCSVRTKICVWLWNHNIKHTAV